MNLKTKISFFLIAIVVVSLFVLMVYLAFQESKPKTSPEPTGVFNENPTDNFDNRPTPGANEEHEEDEPENILQILDLKNRSPYEGQFFTFLFDEDEGLFYVYIDPANQKAGEEEFDKFLKENGVSGKSQFPGLIVKIENF